MYKSNNKCTKPNRLLPMSNTSHQTRVQGPYTYKKGPPHSKISANQPGCAMGAFAVWNAFVYVWKSNNKYTKLNRPLPFSNAPHQTRGQGPYSY